MKKILFIILGIFFISISCFFSLLYLNLLTFGYTFLNYVYFISSKAECMIILPGILLLILGLRKERIR